MKKLIFPTFIFALIIGAAAFGQTVNYTITQQDGKFYFNQVTTSGNGRQLKIESRILNDTAELRAFVFSQATMIYRDQARYESLISDLEENKAAIFKAMAGAGIDDFKQEQGDRFAESFTGSWRFQIRRKEGQGLNVVLSFDASEGRPYRFRQANGNPVGTADFITRTNFEILFVPGLDLNDEPVELFSQNGITFVGRDKNGNIYKIRRL